MVTKEQAKKNKAKQARLQANVVKTEEQKELEKEKNRLSKQKSRANQTELATETIREAVNVQYILLFLIVSASL